MMTSSSSDNGGNEQPRDAAYWARVTSTLRLSRVPSGALNLNVVLRWEYRLGSTLFVVYTRSQIPKVGLLPSQMAGLDFDPIRRGPASQALVLKLSYWWG